MFLPLVESLSTASPNYQLLDSTAVHFLLIFLNALINSSLNITTISCGNKNAQFRLPSDSES